MAIEEQPVSVSKGKKSKSKNRNKKGVKEVRLSENVDEIIVEKEDVIEEYQEKAIKKKKKKNKVKMDTSDGEEAMEDMDHQKKKKEKGKKKGSEVSDEGCDVNIMNKVENGKKKTKKKDVEKTSNDSNLDIEKKAEKKKKKNINDLKGVEEVTEKVKSKKRKRAKKKQDSSAEKSTIMENETKKKRKKSSEEENGSENPKSKKAKKRVSFSSEVEVFNLPAEDNSKEQKSINEDDGLVRGKRFTPEEDEKVKEAVYNYIEQHALGEEGLEMVLNCRKHREILDCWNHIATAIPYRPKSAVYYRAQVIFRKGKNKWTEEEYELIRKYQGEHGNKWKDLAEEFGKHRVQVKDTWRRIKLLNRKKGKWSQDEYQSLFDLVNVDLQLKLTEEKKSKYGMLRDNIHWSAISDKITTRSDANCCIKWYDQLSSPMVSEGLWADADDYRLISELFNLDASCIEDLDWDNLLEHRSGDICRKRWNQMVIHIGENGSKSFAEQVEILAKRYCPSLLEVREDWDNKPVVD